jgi:RHS repeat-associated protein
LLSSYSTLTGTMPLNQVQRAYNGLGQLITEYQEHGGAVNMSTSAKVQYTYSEIPNMTNHSRLKSITYPNGRIVRYEYNSGLDDSISRLSFLADDSSGSVGTHLEEYSYLGLGTVVKRAHPQPGIDLTYIKQTGEANGDAGDQYTGLDRFGRVVDQRWIKTSDGSHTDRLQYTYDRDSNRLARNNIVNSNFNETYGYDNLNQLSSFARGTHTLGWGLDAAGNFSSVTTDGGTPVSRTNNKQNEVTQVGTSTLTFDNNGNTTTDDNGKTLVYDAWNRLVAYKNGMTVLESYKYDALNRRIVQNAGTATDLYYSAAWQVLEEQVAGATQAQYVWSAVYVDALVLRDRGAERLYVQQDANFNVTALVTTAGVVVERDDYDPYGKPTFLNATWSTLTGSGYAWVYLHQGGRFDITTGLYYFRMRDYSPTLMRWTSVDAKGLGAGDSNVYRYAGNDPTNATDPTGQLKVYVWSPHVDAYGHSAVQLSDGTYISWWPAGPGKNKKGRPGGTHSHEDDVDSNKGEGMEADIIVDIGDNCFNEDDTKKWWDDFTSKPETWSATTNSCSDIAAKALNKMVSVANPCYASISHSNVIWTPKDVADYAECLKRWCGSKKNGVVNASGRYVWEYTKEAWSWVTPVGQICSAGRSAWHRCEILGKK